MREDKKWLFYQNGDPLPEEQVDWYSERPKRKRLDEGRLMTLLEKLEASPWQDAFYDFTQPVIRLKRPKYPSTILTKDYLYIMERVRGSEKAFEGTS